MTQTLKARVRRIEGNRPAERDRITSIKRTVVEPSPDGPRETGEVWTTHLQQDGRFGERARES